MGYCMQQTECDFGIEAKEVQKAWDALIECVRQGDVSTWVDVEDLLHASSFAEAMYAARWYVRVADNGNVCYIEFMGEKLGDDLALFEAIAPYVEYGSYIEMSGEDGFVWRYSFRDGEVVEISYC